MSTTRTQLTSDAVLALLASLGRTIQPGTWRAYVARGEAPAPVRHVGRTPLWDRAQVIAWNAGPLEPGRLPNQRYEGADHDR